MGLKPCGFYEYTLFDEFVMIMFAVWRTLIGWWNLLREYHVKSI
jgi:hypothetical protein